MFRTDDKITLENGSYRILSKLGAGGQVQAWKVARQPDEALFALRVVKLFEERNGRQIRRTPALLASLNQRMQDETAFLCSLPDALAHHILPCLDRGLLDDQGAALAAMLAPLMHDELSNYCPNLTHNPKSFTPEQWLRWLVQLATALIHVHQRDSNDTPHVHRDLKPSNVLMDAEGGNAFLTDFGILKAARSIGTTSVAFSAECCAPEQRLPLYLLEETAADSSRYKRQYHITPKADIYALGMLIHNLLMGSTQAQDELSKEGTADTHTREIPSLTTPPQHPQPVGSLGKLGGLLVVEQNALHDKLKGWLRPRISPTGTFIAHDSLEDDTVLPDYAGLANRMVRFIQQMLKPWPEHRPDAQAVLAEVKQWQAFLFPTVEAFSLSAASTFSVGQAVVAELYLQGQGLGDGSEGRFRWLTVTVDASPQAVSWQELPESSAQTRHLQLTLAERLAQGKHRLTVEAWVNGQVHTATHTFELVMSAQQLWEAGQHESALMQELHPAWLEQLLKQQTTTIARYQYIQLLERLKPLHPQESELLSHYIEQADQQPHSVNKETPSALHRPRPLLLRTASTGWNKKRIAGVAGIAVLVFSGWWLTDGKQEPPTVLSGHPEVTNQPLSVLSVNPEVNEADLLTQLRSGTDKTTAYTQLLELAKGNNPNAQAWLGYRYLTGDSVTKDLQAAQQWYQKAADAGSSAAAKQLPEINKAITATQKP